MKLKITLIFVVICYSLSLTAQKTIQEFNINTAYQFSLNPMFKEVINNNTGLREFGVTYKRSVFKSNKYIVLAGVGLSKRVVNQSVGVNHCYGIGLCNANYISRDYFHSSMDVPLEIRTQFFHSFSLSLLGNAQFRFYQNIDYNLMEKFSFELDNVETYLTLNYHKHGNLLSLGVRTLNWMAPDELHYYDYDFLVENPNFFDKSLFYHNPLKIRFSIAHTF